MLVLSRKSRQQIQIGNNIVVTILKVRGSKVSVGIEAPDQVRVLRAEVGGVSPGGLPGAGRNAFGVGSGEGASRAAVPRRTCAQPLAGALRRARGIGRAAAGAEIVSDVAGILRRSAHGSGRAVMVS